MAQRKRERIRQAILSIRDRHGRNDIYPSAAQISKEMGRRTPTLNGRESQYRREVFLELDQQARVETEEEAQQDIGTLPSEHQLSNQESQVQ